MSAEVDQQCWRLAERYARQVGATGLRKMRQQNSGMPEFSITNFLHDGAVRGHIRHRNRGRDLPQSAPNQTRQHHPISNPKGIAFRGCQASPACFRNKGPATQSSEPEIEKGKAQLATAK
jgi:hypothetical protein